MNPKKITVHAPATIANLVCGFDILGLSLKEPYDIMTLETSTTPGLEIVHLDGFALPLTAEENVAGAALLAMMRSMEATDTKESIQKIPGWKLTIDKKIMPGSGLGSSAASAAGAVFAANQLLNNPFSNDDLIQFAMFGEKVASGVKHADNISPCLLGGTTLIRSIQPLDVVQLPTPDLFIVVVHPQIEVRTSDARQILKTDVPLKLAIKQWGNIAGLVAGLMQGDMSLISRSMEDVIIEPARSILIPGFDEVKQRCMLAGALGGGISGSGPSIFMLCENQQTAEKVEEEMKKVYRRLNIHFKTYLTRLNKQGIKIA